MQIFRLSSILALFALSGCSGSDWCSPGEGEWDDDGVCSNGTMCVQDGCYERCGGGGGSCAAGLECDNDSGICVEAISQCRDDSECPGGFECNQGMTYSGYGSWNGETGCMERCGADNECKLGYSCTEGGDCVQ
jgi:hypothetical protein